MPGIGSEPSSAVGEPWQSGKLGKTPDLLRVTFKCAEAGTEFNFHAAETSQRTPNLVLEQPHVFSISSCSRRLCKASLLASGSMKAREYENLGVWKYKIWWKKAFRCGRCILMDAGKTRPNRGNYELLKIAFSHLCALRVHAWLSDPATQCCSGWI